MAEKSKSGALGMIQSALAKGKAAAQPGTSQPANPDGSAPSQDPSATEVAANGAAPSPTADNQASTPEPGTPKFTPKAAEAQAANLVELYFEVEAPEERDVILDQLFAIDADTVVDFLKSTIQHDQDPFIRAVAAAELTRRQVPEGFIHLNSYLLDPEDLFFFKYAIEMLGTLQGDQFYPTVKALWLDTERDLAERQEAMLGMEAINPGQTVADFAEHIDSITDPNTLNEDLTEQMVMTFIREGYDGSKHLEGLKERMGKAPMDDEDDRKLILDFITEGLQLLAADAPTEVPAE